MKNSVKIWIVFIFITVLYFYKIGSIPNGLFVDEAEIGLTTYELLHGNTESFINPFFYLHLDGRYALGTLPVLLATPFIGIFGLDDWTIRFVSTFYGVMSLVLLYGIFRELKMKFALVAVLLTSLTPVYYHTSRINIGGHSSSYFMATLGYYFYILTRQKKLNKFLYVVSGLFFAASAYGYGSFGLSITLFLIAIGISEIIFNRLTIKKYIPIIIVGIGFTIGFIPILHQIKTNPQYTVRIQDKSGKSSLLNKDVVWHVIKNYPKYYDPSYLFFTGDIDGQFDPVLRQSVRGSGELPLSTIFFILLAGGALILKENNTKRYILSACIFLFLFPIPDALTTELERLPYSFVVFSVMLAIPFIIVYALQIFSVTSNSDWSTRFSRLVMYIVISVALIEGGLFFRNYQKYPEYSSGYWGWQWGFREVIHYYGDSISDYDDLYIAPHANSADTLLNFYNVKNTCPQCKLGNYTQYDPMRKQLFADNPESLSKYDEIMQYDIIKTFYYPDSEPAFYIIRPTHEK